MAIVAECSACGKRFKAAETQAGKKAKCSQCGTVFVIGGAAAVPASMAPATPPAPQLAAPPAKPATQPKPAAAAPPAKPATKVVAKAVRVPREDVSSAADSLPADLSANQPATAPRSRKGVGKLVALAATFAILGGAAALVVPKILHRGPADPPAPAQGSGPGGAQVATHVIGPALPAMGAAWATQPDAAVAPLTLGDDFRLNVPSQPLFRHDPNSLVLAAAPSPSAALMLLPEADRAQLPIEIWNLSSRSRTAQFKLGQLLAYPALSQDGGFYAGQYFDPNARANRVEVWATSNGGARVHAIDVPGAAPLPAPAVLGFPLEDQILVYGERLQVWDLNSKAVVREVALPPRADDTRAAASAKLRLVAVGDSKQLTMVDMAQARVLGTAAIPEAVLAHPRRRLALRAVQFSPDGQEVALAFDNRLSTRRIAVYDVATGTLKALHSPAAPLHAGGPEFQWLPDSRGFLVGAGVLLDRATGRQVGQIYGDLGDEGLGGVLNGVVGDDQALLVWDKHPNYLVLRTVPVRREQPQWINVSIASASAGLFKQLQCVSREFGNDAPAQSLLQTGQLTDGRQFLVVDVNFTASLAPDAPPMLPLRQDQFVLLADGQPLLPIGTLTRDGAFSLARPEYDLRKGEAAPRKRSVVFAVTGRENSLALRIASAQQPLPAPAPGNAGPTPGLVPVLADRLPGNLFTAPDDAGVVSVRVSAARVQPFELEPEAADHVPLRVTYSANASVLAVTFELTVNSARRITRGTMPPRLGLLMADGTHLRPAIELPGQLPVTLGVGERRTHTCLFLLNPNAPASRLRLTYDGVPVATVTPDAATAQTAP